MAQALATKLAALIVTLTISGCAGPAPTQAPITPSPSIQATPGPTLAASAAATATILPLATSPAHAEPTGRILYSAVKPTEAFGSLFVMNADGSDVPISFGRGDEPDWSPDSTHVAFIRDDAIWVMLADGSHATSIRHHSSTDVQWPVWSPDGDLIAFLEAPTCGPCGVGMPWALTVMNPDGTGVRKVGDVPSPDRPAWSPDGQTIIYGGEWSDPPTSANGLQSIRLDGTAQRQFSKEHDSYPSWSPDGRFAVLRDVGTTEDGYVLFGLFVADGNGSTPHAVTLPLVLGGPLALSPDGAWLAFPATTSRTFDATSQLDLWIVRPDGTDLRNLTDSTDLQEGFPAWD
jgi:Tol biopolymer transport system component